TAARAFGRLDGAVHAAGTLRDRLIALTEPDDIDSVVGVKARGAVALTAELEQHGASLLVLVSSTSTVLTPAGQVAYVASNAVLDSLAGQ
ncbi:SDR family oxidoreductase, partial [Enterococcus casseliflavus]|uniref:SDR family oxidoreductase n=1 Tax=Enterococcus casseliflavus TaxID=37734 RepID=UPI003D1073E3